MHCPKCSHPAATDAKFCTECGAPLRATLGNRPQYTLRCGVGILVLAGGLWAASYGLSTSQAGVKPTTKYTEPAAAAAAATTTSDDPEIKTLTAAAEKDRQNVGAWQKLADTLIQRLQASDQTPDQTLVFSTIEALSNILRLEPKDARALIAMADISFNQQVFDKSVTYYERFLALEPKDHPARARFASALSFLGRFDEAIVELNKVLAEEPDNFHALAYLAITYAQKGDVSKAKEIGVKALDKAPNEEARARFGEFLTKINEDSSMKESLGKAEEPQTAPEGSDLPAVVGYLKSNSIAGPKFVRHEVQGTTVTVYFRAFPMDHMPPFAKDKFFAGVRTANAGSPYKVLLFKDADSGAELSTVDLAG